MAVQSAFGRAAARISLAFAVVLSLIGLAGPAQAQDEQGWVLVATDTDDGQWYVNPDLVGRTGGYVYSAAIFQPGKREKAPGTRRRFAYSITQQVDDCGAKTASFGATVYFDRKQETVAREEMETDELVFSAVESGTIGEAVSGYVCALADKLIPPEPAIPLQEVKTAEWRIVTPDGGDGQSVAVLPDSAERRGAAARVVARLDYANGDKMPDGRTYRTMVSSLLFNCATRHYVASTTDYYNLAGALMGGEAAETGQPPVAIQPEDVVADAAAFACAVESVPVTGTGWLAAPGYIVTASHAVDGAERIQVFQDGRGLGEAQVVRDDPVNDVAVLKPLFDTARHAALRISAGPAALGQRVFTLGYPLADELGVGAVKMTAGDVSSLSGVDVDTGRIDDRRFLQVSIPVQGGNSGGPVIGPDGTVVGLVVSKMQATDDEITQNVNFALKAGYVSSLIDGLPQIGKARVSTAKGDTAALVAGVQSGVFLIVAGPAGVERQAER